MKTFIIELNLWFLRRENTSCLCLRDSLHICMLLFMNQMKWHGNVMPVQRGDHIHQHRLCENKSFKFDSWLDSTALWLRKHSRSLSAWAVNDVYLRMSIYTPHTKAPTACETTMNLNQKTPRQEFSIIRERGGLKTCVRERSFGVEIWQREALSFQNSVKLLVWHEGALCLTWLSKQTLPVLAARTLLCFNSIPHHLQTGRSDGLQRDVVARPLQDSYEMPNVYNRHSTALS